MTQAIYEIKSLEHSYGEKTVVAIDHLDVQPASIVGIVGPNGSGKSSLLRLLGLIEKPTRGEILFNGRPVEPFSDEARFRITLLPQEPFLMKRSVFNNVVYGLKLRGNGDNMAAKVNKALELVGLSSDDFAQRPWYALSGGEAQRVALAARLALKPEVLLLDEPTASVDAASAQLIKEASLRARRELGTTLIVASHDWQWLYEICDEVLHLFRGRIFGTGRESIIFGPWQELTAGKWGKRLSDNQALYVSKPPDQTAVAVLNELSVCKAGAPASDETVILQGIVSRLGLEGKSGQLSMTVLVGDLSFTVRLPSRYSPEHTVFPGKKINIQYRLDGIKWA